MAENVKIVTGLGYGDECKGATVDALTRQVPDSTLVVKTTGGPQAAHNVVTPEGIHHTFSQFGSGSFVGKTKTHLGPYVLVNPLNMFLEADHLMSLGVHDIWSRVSVDPRCLVITPWQRALNQLREIDRGASRHGSCAQGVGETKLDELTAPDLVIRVRDLQSSVAQAKLEVLRKYKLNQAYQQFAHLKSGEGCAAFALLEDEGRVASILPGYQNWASRVSVIENDALEKLFDMHAQVICEGAQGVLLDEWFGFHPYTTWSTTTHDNALDLLAEVRCDAAEIERLGLLRAVSTRHGAGPLVTESPMLDRLNPIEHNQTEVWQGAFRFGYLDLIALQYAVTACGGVDGLVVSCLDLLHPSDDWQYCQSYDFTGKSEDVCDLFLFSDENTVREIVVGEVDMLDRQQRITQALFSCHPNYHRITVSDGSESREAYIAQYLDIISECLGAPIVSTAYGPRANDRLQLVTR